MALLRDAFELLSPSGVFVQFTYGMISPIPRRVAEGVPFTAEASQPVWLNLPPARVWCYRPASAPVARKANVAQQLVRSIKTHTSRVRDEIRETRDKLETEFRLARDRMRIDIAGRRSRVSEEARANEAAELLRKLKDRRGDR